MKAGMKAASLVVALIVAGCVQLPSVSLRLRARFDRTATRTARAVEARVDCAWALERGLTRSAAPGAMAAVALDPSIAGGSEP